MVSLCTFPILVSATFCYFDYKRGEALIPPTNRGGERLGMSKYLQNGGRDVSVNRAFG